MDRNYKAIMLTILTLSCLVIAIVELTGISPNGIFRKFHGGGEGVFYTKDGEVYHGEIYPEQTITRSQRAAQMARTTVQFYETKYNFGSISEGAIVKHSFRFKNTGMNPLYIAKTDVTCGCTVPSFPQDQIAPDAEGEIMVEFNPSGKSGIQQKNIIVHSNALPEAISIGIEADVK